MEFFNQTNETSSQDGGFAIAGMGHDVVDCAEFREQLQLPGSRFEKLFSRREIAQCRMRAQQVGVHGMNEQDAAALDINPQEIAYAQHLAARWAGKEAFLKAWSHALAPSTHMPYTIDNFPWSSIEIMQDSVHRPAVVVSDDVERTLADTLGSAPRIHISLSHDGGIASAVVIVEKPADDCLSVEYQSAEKQNAENAERE